MAKKNSLTQIKPGTILIVVLVALAIWTLYPPQETLKPGLDLAGGTSLIYEIDTFGLTEEEKEDLSQRMITVLRRRIDPINIQNLIWRPQGNDRFEIQMPLTSAEARQKREAYEEAERELLNKNLSRSKVVRLLKKPADERTTLFNELTQSDPNRLTILENLATNYDKRIELQNSRDVLIEKLDTAGENVSSAGIDLDSVESLVIEWSKLGEQELQKSLSDFTDVNDNIPVLTGYVQAYTEWAGVVNELTGINSQYKDAMFAIDKLNLTLDMLNLCLEMTPDSIQRKEQIKQFKIDFPDRIEEIDKTVAAFDEYRPFKGRLDDPKDLQRMLKGAGILEFRILPTANPAYVDVDAMKVYVDRLEEQGPEYASDNDYIWLEIDDIDEWQAADAEKNPSIFRQFGDKYYVLASNNSDETILHSRGEQSWKLEKSYSTQDRIGRRAIGFTLDERGGTFFAEVTENNICRPLCILLDDIAISAPNIETRVGRQGVITGSFTQTQVRDMVDKLNAGSLPARLIEQPISVNTIGPSIGADNRDQGIKAGLIGLVCVIICMAIYYLLAGAIADVALLMNMLFILAIMAGIGATFTLPGIAGLILTIGMSVDANVLIFERIREEQSKEWADKDRKGKKHLQEAIKNGYEKALSTIFDANITTFITALILYLIASEEVKGFAIVLMIGIASSMFTALVVTRKIFDFLASTGFVKTELHMLELIHKLKKLDWMKLRPVFFTISSVLIVSGLYVFFSRDNVENNKYDIEFTGGTSAQIVLLEDAVLTRQQVEDKIRAALPGANVYSVGETDGKFEITTTETNKITVNITLSQASPATQIVEAIKNAQKQFAGNLNNLIVAKEETNAAKFIITTSQMNQSLVKEVLTAAFPNAEISEPQVDEVVNNAILNTFADQLEIQQNLQPNIVSEEKITEELIDTYPELAEFVGGVKIDCEISRAATLYEINQRINDLRFKPDMRDLIRYDYKIFNSSLDPSGDPNEPLQSFIYVSSDPEAGVRELSEEDWTMFTENEKTKILGATTLETSLPRVRQFDPSVGKEQKTRAIIAIILSLISIVTYIWIRFGNVRYGLAAIVALIHDVCITLGFVTFCTYIAGIPLFQKLLIGDFKIDLAMIAAFLTLIGYSLNDTIVVFDRIRENRKKNQDVDAETINKSINQTIPRTILTSFTTFIVVLIMYIFGGQGLRGFTFAIGIGIIIGTYSSIALASPILLLGVKKPKKGEKK